jgi:hypothetical protein
MRTGADTTGNAARGQEDQGRPAAKPMVFVVDDEFGPAARGGEVYG